MTKSNYFTDYRTTRMSDGNPYRKCAGCGHTEPYINGDINKHGDGCSEVRLHLAKSRSEEFDHIINKIYNEVCDEMEMQDGELCPSQLRILDIIESYKTK